MAAAAAGIFGGVPPNPTPIALIEQALPEQNHSVGND
jgi:hypothetical protein